MPQSNQSGEKKNHIVKEGGKWRLLSHEGKNLGDFDSEEEAKKHEAQVECFKEKKNSISQKPNFYYARHMQPGTCRYDKEMILVDTDAMQKMIRTGAGIPVYIHHQINVPLDEAKEKAAGWVTESFYNELDGWAWFKMMAIDDEIRMAVSNGWSVSNAYRPSQWGEGNTKNNVPYDREIKDGEFTHLAIVPNPRYEGACILSPEEFKSYQENQKAKLSELQNSNPSRKEKPMFKFFKNKREDVTSIDAATHVELENGKVVTVEEMINAVKKNSDTEKLEKKELKDLENETVDVQGEKMPIKELVNRYTKMNEKRNAEEEEKRKKDEEEKKNSEKRNAEEKAAKEAEEKKSAEEEEKRKKEEEEEKTNGKKFFDELINAHQSAPAAALTTIDTGISMTARGQARYGSGALK